MRSYSRLWHIVLLALLVTVPSFAQNTVDDDGALLEDAARYAVDFGVDLDEAVRRLQLQERVGALDQQLTIRESGTFAGL